MCVVLCRNPESVREMRNWNLQFAQNLLTISARHLQPENIFQTADKRNMVCTEPVVLNIWNNYEDSRFYLRCSVILLTLLLLLVCWCCCCSYHHHQLHQYYYQCQLPPPASADGGNLEILATRTTSLVPQSFTACDCILCGTVYHVHFGMWNWHCISFVAC